LNPLDLPVATLAVIALAFFLGSTVKGALGAGIPAVGMPIMVMVIEPALAASLFVVPVALSNIWQIWQAGHYREAIRRFWPFLVTLMIGVWLGVGLLTSVAPKLLALALGVVVVATTLGQMFVREIRGLRGRAGFVHPIGGFILGICGGATGMFAPTIVYFAALRLEKDLFVTQLALVASCGSLALYARLVLEGRLHFPQLELSTYALLPTAIGLTIGFWSRKCMSEVVFRRAVWTGLLALGSALILRGLGIFA
jgi:uncharacterized membrane protein YfcA